MHLDIRVMHLFGQQRKVNFQASLFVRAVQFFLFLFLSCQMNWLSLCSVNTISLGARYGNLHSWGPGDAKRRNAALGPGLELWHSLASRAPPPMGLLLFLRFG